MSNERHLGGLVVGEAVAQLRLGQGLARALFRLPPCRRYFQDLRPGNSVQGLVEGVCSRLKVWMDVVSAVMFQEKNSGRPGWVRMVEVCLQEHG